MSVGMMLAVMAGRVSFIFSLRVSLASWHGAQTAQPRRARPAGQAPGTNGLPGRRPRAFPVLHGLAAAMSVILTAGWEPGSGMRPVSVWFLGTALTGGLTGAAPAGGGRSPGRRRRSLAGPGRSRMENQFCRGHTWNGLEWMEHKETGRCGRAAETRRSKNSGKGD